MEMHGFPFDHHIRNGPLPRTTIMSGIRFCTPSIVRDLSAEPDASMDHHGELNIPALVQELCTDFSNNDKGVVSDLLLRIFPLPPADGFNLLLVAAAVSHARVTDCSRIASH